jgi:quinolinate synthase
MLARMSIASFPSLLVYRDRLVPQGSFAEAQAAFLAPDTETVATLDRLVREKNVGIVAHYYMDPELQGVLARLTWPHVWISDSLLMADQAVKMAERGVARVVVLGVDFMSENARAMLDAGGFPQVPVYRVAAEPIGCSLAAAADSLTYSAWLEKASRTPKSIHVVYINTSLRTKARAHAKVPTITCTSSNVLPTVLDAFASIEGGHVFFGPDTYMGRNLAQHSVDARGRGERRRGARRAPGPHPGLDPLGARALSLLRAGQLRGAPPLRRRGGGGGAEVP